MKQLFLILHFSFFIFNSSAQVRAIKFPELQNILDKKNDTTVVVNFWATWCKPCVQELPYFNELSKNSSNQKLKVILVSLDFKRELNSRLVTFVNENKITANVVLLDEPDYNSWMDKVDTTWGGGIPCTLIIYPNNRKYFYEREFSSYAELEKIVKPLIQK
jgi:thiol-disulfide isomerase/thioredoxin